MNAKVVLDGLVLVSSESYGNCLTAFDIGAGGALPNRRVWADPAEDHPDGICLDAEGAVWAADVGNKHCVRVREGGQVLAVQVTVPSARIATAG